MTERKMKTFAAGRFVCGGRTSILHGGRCTINALTRSTALFVVVVIMFMVTICFVVNVEAFAVVVRPCSSSSSSSTRITSISKSAHQKQLRVPLELLQANKGPPALTKIGTSCLFAAEQQGSPSSNEKEDKGSLKFLLDPGTKGGAVFLSILLFLVPIAAYNIIITVNTDVDPLDAGKWIGAGFTILATLAWVSTYIFRVATKDMTYVSVFKNTSYALCVGGFEKSAEQVRGLQLLLPMDIDSILTTTTRNAAWMDALLLSPFFIAGQATKGL
jgi:Protein of unknown function (DUF3007)